MDSSELEHYRRLFLDYADSHLNGDKNDAYHIRLKREHSLRVLANAKVIAASLELPAPDERLALLSALLHDVGRFPQYLRYKTFLDRESKDHGILGTTVLGRTTLLAGVDAEERQVIRAVVGMHNRKEVPQGISVRLRRLVEVVRDADKVDILYVMVAHFQRKTGDFPVVTLHVRDEAEAYTKEVYEDAFSGAQGDYKKMVYVNDFKLLLCGWVSDFNYPASRRLVHERGLLRDLMATLPDFPEMRRLKEVVQARLEKGL